MALETADYVIFYYGNKLNVCKHTEQVRKFRALSVLMIIITSLSQAGHSYWVISLH